MAKKNYMTKEELVTYVAQKAGLKKADAYKAVNAFIDAVKDALSKGKGVRLVGAIGRPARAGTLVRVSLSPYPPPTYLSLSPVRL